MRQNENLQREIFKKTEYKESIFYGEFIDSNVNKSFNRVLQSKNKIMIIVSGILHLLFHAYLLYDLKRIEVPNYYKFAVFSGISLLINTISLIIIIISDGSSRKNNIFLHIKFCSQLTNVFVCLLIVSIYVELDKVYIFSRILIIGYFLSFIEFVGMNFYSRFLAIITFIAFFSITILSSFSIKKFKMGELNNCNTYFY